MKTTRILGFAAGLMAIFSILVIAFGAFFTMNPQISPDMMKLGYGALVLGLISILASAVPGIAHLILRFWFHRPYQDPNGPRGFLIACRVLVWVWAISLVAIVALAGLWGFYQFI